MRDGTHVRRRTTSRLGALKRDADEQECSIAEERRRARSFGVARASGAPPIAARTTATIEDGLTDGAAVAVDAPRHVPAVLAPAGPLAGGAERGRVAEGKPEQCEADMHALVDENPVQVSRVDLEVRRRQFDRRMGDSASSPFDHRTTRTTQAAIPSNGDLGPRDDPERTRDGVEGTIAFQEQRRSGDHGVRVRVRRDAPGGVACRGRSVRYPRPVPASHRSTVFGVLALLALASCGSRGKQNRPAITAIFPVDGAVVAGWVDTMKVTYDEPIRVLNSYAVRLADNDTGESIAVEAFADPTDPYSILVKPIAGGHLFPGDVHHLVVQEGAVVNANDHYMLQERSSYFTVGVAPNLVVTSSNGSAYEIDTVTGAVLSTTTPPAGFRSREPIGTAARIWVWLDPTPGPGDSALGTFVPGDAAMTTVALAGELGVRTGVSFAVSIDGKTLYATATDAVRNRLLLHRVDVATRTEIGAPLVLSPALAGSPASFTPCLDFRRNRLYVPFSDGLGGGNLAVVDLSTFSELDVGPAPGVDALPTPDGSGDCAYEPFTDVFFLLLEDEPMPGFVLIGPTDFAQFPAREPSLQGTPISLFITPPGDYIVQGLDAYDATDGIVRSNAQDIGEGFAFPALDDVGGTLQGSDRVTVMVNDPVLTRFHLFSSDGVESWMLDYEWYPSDVAQIDLDVVTPGVQAIAMAPGVPGIVTGAAYPLGASAP